MIHQLKIFSIISFLLMGKVDPKSEAKIETGYIIQEIGINTSHDHYKLFTGFNSILSIHNEYYTLREDHLIQAIKIGRIDLSDLIMIVEPTSYIYMKSDSNKYETLLLNYSCGLEKLLRLDDTGVYEIGGKYYALRKCRYKYVDNIQLRYKDEDGVLQEFKSNNIRLFLYTQELLSTPKSVNKSIFKKRYEFSDFWHDYVKKHINQGNNDVSN